MREALGPRTVLGYCTNVHAGSAWDQTRANLLAHAPAVRDAACPGELLGVGLWLSARSARELVEGGELGAVGDLLAAHGLLAYTFNGFPYGDFHRPVVKHDVYEPDWSAPERLRYTQDLVTILDGLLPQGATGSISTLPVGWQTIGADPARLEAARANLRTMAGHLRALEAETGRLIHVDLEPEPGCFLQRAADVVDLFRGLGGGGDITRYLRVCHDVCHAAVMFEDQRAVIGAYDAAGIAVGKVQVSSAVRVAFDELDPGARRAAAEELGAFSEKRYLHQTVVRDPSGRTEFFEDLPEALTQRANDPRGEWRVHYHVPVYLERFGKLLTTRGEITDALEALRGRVEHWEVETYAWEVLPAALRTGSLAEGIARELTWLRDHAAATVPRA